MKKDIEVENYAAAFRVLYNEYLEFSNLENEKVICSELPAVATPETLLLKYDTWLKLSEEAKEIINTILNAPIEVIQTFQTPKHKRISYKLIKKHFQKEWRSSFITDSTLEEIKQWANQL